VESNSKIETSYKAYLQSHVISNSTNTYRTTVQNSTQTASKCTCRRINDGSKCPDMLRLPDDEAT